MKCNKKNMKTWIKDLRSGKYRQTEGQLCSRRDSGHKTFCCLGVATDRFLKENGYTWEDNPWGIYELDDLLSDKVSNWLGLSEADPIVCTIEDLPKRCNIDEDEYISLYGDKNVCASTANDEYRLKFKTIADRLEKTYGIS